MAVIRHLFGAWKRVQMYKKCRDRCAVEWLNCKGFVSSPRRVGCGPIHFRHRPSWGPGISVSLTVRVPVPTMVVSGPRAYLKMGPKTDTFNEQLLIVCYQADNPPERQK